MQGDRGESRTSCASCGSENPEGSRFCGDCGHSLAATCESCGAENPADKRYCTQCGAALGEAEPDGASETEPPAHVAQLPDHLAEKLSAQAGRLAGERKQVTVLFADVMGSMDLAERTDPERWRGIMDRFFGLLADAVHRFEGTVDKFTGDGIMAVFGAPIAHEDHAQRACYAALEMQRAVSEYSAELRRSDGLSLSTRIGINSGEVVVGSIGEAGTMEYTAVGHTVGLAQRMESLAEPGKTYLTDDTARLAGGFLELTDLGEFEVKGASAPLEVFELVGIGSARGRLDVSSQRGFSRFVGRGTEMIDLAAGLERAVGGEGQVVGVVAEPGVGKSRLCHEFAERCRAQGIAVYETQCQAHGRELPLLPVLQMMRSYFGIEPEDSERAAREKIAGRLLLLDPGFGDDLGLVFEFLGVPDPERPPPEMSADARQRRLLDMVRRLYQTRSRDEAVVNVIEDLHWIDPASEVFLGAMIESVPGTGALVVTNFRPEYRADWMRRSYYRQLPLAPLGTEAVEELLADLLGTDPSLDGLAELIRERTGGNPFYIEEVTRELAGSGALAGEKGAYRLERQIDEIAVPPTVQSILASRIDRLPPAAKRTLQAAATIGAEFSRGLVAAATDLDGEELDRAVGELVEAEFVFETSLYPEPEFAFRHPLTREVAYGSQLALARARAHGAIARRLAEGDEEGLDERAGLIAQHFEEAGEALEAAQWHARAAVWVGFNDPTAARGHWLRIRELDDQLPEVEEADSLRAGTRMMIVSTGWRLGADVEETRAVFEEGRALAERKGDLATLALLHTGFGITVGTCGGDVAEFVRIAAEAGRICERIEDPAARVAVTTGLYYPLWLAGRYEDALRALDTILELTADAPELGAGVTVTNSRAWATSFRGAALQSLGRFAEARQALASGAELCRRWDRESLGWTHSITVGLAYLGGEPPDAGTVAHGRQAVEIADRLGDGFSRVVAHMWLGLALHLTGSQHEALAVLDRCLETIQSRGVGLEYEGFVRSGRAITLEEFGRLDEAVAEAERGLAINGERGVVGNAARVRNQLAEVLIARAGEGDLDRAASVLDENERQARELGDRPDVVKALIVRARLLDRLGDAAGRGRARAEATALAREMDARGLLAELESEAGALRQT